jgi:hypothetical protein
MRKSPGGEKEDYLVLKYTVPDRRVVPRRQGVEHGIALAREIGAKVTAVTVTEPFCAFALAPNR